MVYVKKGNIVTQMAALGLKRTKKNELVSRLGLSVVTGIVGAAAQGGQPI